MKPSALRAPGLVIFILSLMTVSARGAADQDPGSVYLAYAGPYSTSPSSAFGHLFLILQPNDETPIPLWDVISFNADTEGAGFLKFFFGGISGSFMGSYGRNLFHEKVRSYEVLEDRDLWLVSLRLSPHEHDLLLEKLKSSEGQRFPYRFFSRNCAYYLQLLLSEVHPAVPRPTGKVSPVGVLELALELGIAEGSFYRPALSSRLARDSHRLSSPVARRLDDESWRELAADHEWLRTLGSVDRALVQERLSLEALKQTEPLEPCENEGLALLRVLSAAAPPGQEAGVVASRPGQPIPDPNFHAYGRWTASSGFAKGREPTYALRFRPALHEANDPWLGYRPVNTLSTLAITVSIATDPLEARVQEFTLFSQKSLTPAGAVLHGASWLLDIGMRRGGLWDASTTHYGLRFGRGVTVNPLSGHFAYILGTGAALASRRHSPALAPGCQVGVLGLLQGSWRWGSHLDWQFDISETSRDFAVLEAWIRHDIASDWGVTIRIKDNSGSERIWFELDFDWYP